MNCFVRNGHSVELITGSVEYNYAAPESSIRIKKYNQYNNSSFTSRITSGLWFTIRSFLYLLFQSRKKELIVVSTPPFIFYTAWLLNRIRNQRYHLVTWDLYPDVLVNFSSLKRTHLIVRIWSKMNEWCFTRAATIFTLGQHLAQAIQNYANVDPVVIPNWVDTSFIVPLERTANPFVQQHGLDNKLVVLYSGNLGLTHDIESIVHTAKELQGEESIKFVIIGEGSKLPVIQKYVSDHALNNVLMLPYQDRSVLPFSLTSADISVVTLSKGAESVSVPSKTYYSLAAGSALIALASRESELGVLIAEYDCGFVFDNYQATDIAAVIRKLKADRNELERLKENARKASYHFTPANASTYYEIITKAGKHVS
jgi:glycosyltransferase involved in cell wall biosynthesis